MEDRLTKTTVYSLSFFLCIFWSFTAFAAGKGDNIRISYKEPKSPELLIIHNVLQKQQTLERVREFLKPYRLPRKLKIELSDCDGESDAFYGDYKITICYEYINLLWQRMPARTTHLGVEPIDTVIGPLVDTTLHEFAHALFDILKIPVLGGEEHAADQVGAYIYLQLGIEEARRLITGTAFAFLFEAAKADNENIKADYSDEHGTPAQRAYNMLCMAYGADTREFKDFVGKGFLPEKRAEFCEEEYEQVQDAYEALIGPYVDQALADEVFDRSWILR
jgi:hypothetical protein